MELKDLIEKLNKNFEEYKATNDARLTALANGQGQAEFKAKLEKIDAEIEKIQAKIEEVNAKAARKGTKGQDAEEDDTARKAFVEFARRGAEGLTADYRNVLIRADDTTGGYFAPAEMLSEIIRTITEFSPVRQFVRVRNTGQRSVMVPKKTGTFSAVWIGESDTRSETTGTAYGMEEIPTNELTAEVYISQLDLEDSQFDLEGEMRADFAEQFGVAEGTAVISGSGVKRPEGLLTASGVGEVNSGHATEITADGMINLYYEPKADYARVGRWLLNRTSLRSIRKLKDGNGQYLWLPGIIGTQPPTILGAPYTECVDMPSEGAGTYPVLFGDFRRAYILVDRLAMAVMRDPFTRASQGQIKFVARRRVGGQVVLTEAFKKLKCAA